MTGTVHLLKINMMLICSDDEAALLLHYFWKPTLILYISCAVQGEFAFLGNGVLGAFKMFVLSVRLLSQDSWGLGNLWPEKHRISVTSNESMPQRKDKFKRCD